MVPNPYTPGQVPRVLVGRDRELQRVRSRLGRVSTFHEFGGPLLTFHGPRGLGKTSLLRAAEKDAWAAGFVTVWVSVARSAPLLRELRAATDLALRRSDTVRIADVDRWRTTSSTFAAEVAAHLGPLTGRLTRSTTREAPEPFAAPITALVELLGEAARLVTEPGGSGLAVFLDELHAADAADLSVLLNALQNLDGDRERHPLAVFAAGLPSTPGLLTRAATFGERTSFVELYRLDDAAAAAALLSPAQELEVSWDPDALQAVLRAAGGYPYFLQLLGDTAWEAAAPDAGATIGLQDALAGRRAALEQLRAMYGARWDAATSAEKDFLVAMSGQPEPVTRASIAGRLGLPSRSLSGPRDRLVEKGIIEPVHHGQLRFTLPGFGAFVSSQVDPDASFAELVFATPGELPGSDPR